MEDCTFSRHCKHKSAELAINYFGPTRELASFGQNLVKYLSCAERDYNKLETSKDALWKRKNFNTENWKPCTLDLSPCGKRNAEKSRLGHLWIVFYKSYPTLFALSHPFKPLVDYRLLCSQYNTGKTLEPACQRGLLLALKISIFGQLCLFPTGRIWSCAAMKSQIYI